MKKILSILLVLLLLLFFVSCDPDELDPEKGSQSGTEQGGGAEAGDHGDAGGQSGESGGADQKPEDQGGQGGGEQKPDPQPGDTYTVTFIQEGLDNVVETYASGELLWVHAPELPENNTSGHFYNWDAELDTPVTSNMTVTRTDNTGHAIFFKLFYDKTVKIVVGQTLAVEDFPAPPVIDGYTGVWWQYEDIDTGWYETYPVGSWFYSNEKYESTGMPKYFMYSGLNGTLKFELSEYPIQVSGNTLKYVNKTNFANAGDGQTPITESECAAVVDALGNSFKTTYATYDAKQATDWLAQNSSTTNLGFVNAIKVMRQQTSDNGWSIPQGAYMQFVLKRLFDLGAGEDSFYTYLHNGDDAVKVALCSSFFVSYGHQRMLYSWIEDGEGVASEYYYGGTFYGYLWPIKPIE